MSYITTTQILYNPKDGAYGAKGNGTTDDYTALFNANAAAVAAGSRIYLSKGIYKISSNLTLDGIDAEFGVTLKPDNGITITIAGGINAPLDCHLFDTSLAGGKSIFILKNMDISVQWFGAKCDGAIINGSVVFTGTNDLIPLQAAHDSLVNGGIILIPSGITFITGILYFSNNYIKIKGSGSNSTYLYDGSNLGQSLIWLGHNGNAQQVVPTPIVGSSGNSLFSTSASFNSPIINLTEPCPSFNLTGMHPSGPWPNFLDGITQFSFSGLWKSNSTSITGAPIFGSSGDIGYIYGLSQAIYTTNDATSITFNCTIKDGSDNKHIISTTLPVNWIDGYHYQYAMEIDCVGKKLDGYVYNFDTSTLHSNSASFSGLSGSCSISQQWYEVFYLGNYSLGYQWTPNAAGTNWHSPAGQDGYYGPFRYSTRTTYYDSGFTPLVSNMFSQDNNFDVICNFDGLDGPGYQPNGTCRAVQMQVNYPPLGFNVRTGLLPLFGINPTNIGSLFYQQIENISLNIISIIIGFSSLFKLTDVILGSGAIILQAETEEGQMEGLSVFPDAGYAYALYNQGWVFMRSCTLQASFSATQTQLINGQAILFYYDLLLGQTALFNMICLGANSTFRGDFLNFDNEDASTLVAGALITGPIGEFVVRSGTWAIPNVPSFIFSGVNNALISIDGGEKQFGTQPFIYIDPNTPMSAMIDVNLWSFEGGAISLTNDARYVTYRGEPIIYALSPQNGINYNINLGGAQDVIIGTGATDYVTIASILPPVLGKNVFANINYNTVKLQNFTGQPILVLNNDTNSPVFNRIISPTGNDLYINDQMYLQYFSPGRAWGATTAGAVYVFGAGEIVLDGNGHWFQTVAGGTTGATTPSWNTTTIGSSTTTDGTITWVYMGNVGWRIFNYGITSIPPTDTFVLTYNQNDNQWEPLPGVIDGYINVDSISPILGDISGGDEVTISGSGFSQAQIASVGNLHLKNFTVVNDATITGLTVPHASSQNNPVYVVSDSGTSVLLNAFEYFNPLSISSKIYIWLRADLGFGTSGITATWKDQTSNHINMTGFADISGLTINNPTITASAINGKPAVTFNSAHSQSMFNNTNFGSPAQGHAFIIAQGNQTEPPVSGQGLWNFGTGPGGFVDFSDGNIYDNFGSTSRYNTTGGTSSHPDLSLPFVYEVQSTNSSWNAFVNNTNVITSGTNTVGWVSAFVELGHSITYYNGYIAEVIIFDQILTTDERNKVNTYLQGRYNITL